MLFDMLPRLSTSPADWVAAWPSAHHRLADPARRLDAENKGMQQLAAADAALLGEREQAGGDRRRGMHHGR
jgi:hypothetical protein